MVVHHHEYIDGSGYPHGLKGNEILDLVRMTTISDVFVAPIERRFCKPPFVRRCGPPSSPQHGPKLDKDLV